MDIENLHLDQLNKADLQKVERLIQKLADKKNNKPKRSRKKHRPKEQHIVNQQPKTNKPNKEQRIHKPTTSGTRQCATQSLEIIPNRENKFLQLPENKAHKADTLIDKKLSGDNEITARQGTRLIEVKCNRCGKKYTVSPKLLYKTEDGVTFICNNCQRRR